MAKHSAANCTHDFRFMDVVTSVDELLHPCSAPTDPDTISLSMHFSSSVGVEGTTFSRTARAFSGEVEAAVDAMVGGKKQSTA